MRKQERKNIFQSVSERWFLTEPALFAIYCSHRIVANDKLLCTMRSGKGHIEYNPAVVSAMAEHEVEECLRAEVYRILLKHPYERKPFNCSETACTLGSDCVLSSYYSWQATPLAKPADFKLQDRQHYEWYALEIEKMMRHDDNESGSTGEDTNEDGDASEGSNGSPKQDASGNDGNEAVTGLGNDAPSDASSPQSTAISQQSELWEEDSLMQASVNDIIEETHSWGTIPRRLVECIIASTQARIDYRKVLSGFRASIISSRRSLTRMRPNRRTGFQSMGSLYRFRTNLLVGIDVSASVDRETLRHVYSVVNRFFRYGIENIDIVQFDCDLGTVRNYKKASTKIEICGRGGTDFQPVIDYACAHNYDGLIIFTDGYAPEPTMPSGTHTRLLWVCQDDQTYKEHRGWMGNTGRVCVIYNS